VLILLIAVAGIGISGLATMASQFTGYAAISRTTVNVVAIDRTVVGLRRNVAQFAQTRDEKALQRIAELRNDFETLLQEARAETDEDERDFLDRMEKIFRDYLTQFDSVIEILRTRDAIERDTLLPIGNRMVAKLDEAIGIATRAGDHAIAGQLSGGAQHLLLARLSAVRFLNSPSTELRAEIEKEFDLLTQALNGLFGSVHNTQINSLLMEVANLASEYTQAYDRFADLLMAASNTINGPMENLAAELASLATTANSAQRVELEQIEARASEVSAAAQTIGIVVSIVAVVLGVLCAWLIARGIVRPVTGMTDDAAPCGQRHECRDPGPGARRRDRRHGRCRPGLQGKHDRGRAHACRADGRERGEAAAGRGNGGGDRGVRAGRSQHRRGPFLVGKRDAHLGPGTECDC